MRALLLIALAALPLAAAGEYDGPALEACREFGVRTLKQDGTQIEALAFDNDRHLLFRREARELGSQHASASLSGHGMLVGAAGPAVPMSFLCLLASEQRALWFHWLARSDAPALGRCRRSADTGACLQLLLELAERDLLAQAASRFQESLDADARAGNEAASSAFRKSAAAWRGYRDAECARRGASGSDAWRACRVDLTRRRYLDLE